MDLDYTVNALLAGSNALLAGHLISLFSNQRGEGIPCFLNKPHSAAGIPKGPFSGGAKS